MITEEQLGGLLLALHHAECLLPADEVIKRGIQVWHDVANNTITESEFFTVCRIHRDNISEEFDQQLAESLSSDDLYYIANEMYGDAMGRAFTEELRTCIEYRYEDLYKEWENRHAP